MRNVRYIDMEYFAHQPVDTSMENAVVKWCLLILLCLSICVIWIKSYVSFLSSRLLSWQRGVWLWSGLDTKEVRIFPVLSDLSRQDAFCASHFPLRLDNLRLYSRKFLIVSLTVSWRFIGVGYTHSLQSVNRRRNKYLTLSTLNYKLSLLAAPAIFLCTDVWNTCQSPNNVHIASLYFQSIQVGSGNGWVVCL